jgi:hypothetical protein
MEAAEEQVSIIYLCKACIIPLKCPILWAIERLKQSILKAFANICSTPGLPELLTGNLPAASFLPPCE